MMSKRGRPANQQPATLWDYRRAKHLLDVLATAETTEAFYELCEQWGVECVWEDMSPLNCEKVNVWATLRKLAQYVLEHGRDQQLAATLAEGE
jgi:hypothetical protein